MHRNSPTPTPYTTVGHACETEPLSSPQATMYAFNCNESTITIATFRGSLLRGPSFTLPQAWADLGSHIWDHIQIGAYYRNRHIDSSPLHILQMLLRSFVVDIQL